MSKIFAVVVVYNPVLSELKDLVNTLSAQVSRIIVCNNSQYDIDLPCQAVKIFNFQTNLGIAAAQSIGIKWAMENGADFILQMDQDSLPSEKMVDKLCGAYNRLTELGYQVGLVGPLDYDKLTGEINSSRLRNGKYIENDQYVLVDSTLSSGSLIPRHVVEQVGGMMNDLFIDAVDHEYCWRIIAQGFIVALNLDATIAHRIGDGRKNVLGLISVAISHPYRHYYAMRNSIYLLRLHYAPLRWKIGVIPRVLVKLLIYPLLLDKGYLRFRFMAKGLYHGVIGKLGPMR